MCVFTVVTLLRCHSLRGIHGATVTTRDNPAAARVDAQLVCSPSVYSVTRAATQTVFAELPSTWLVFSISSKVPAALAV